MAENKAASFVENVNTVANATVLATGDVLEDCQIARDAAEASAEEASISEQNADYYEGKSKEWATKQYNNPVEDNQFSSYHWAVVSSQNSAGSLIDDDITSVAFTWSSQKISTSLSGKSDATHLHQGIYEPVFDKNSAFNKSFTPSGGNNGVTTTVSRGDHIHGYEPSFDKNTAFNKNFGTESATVAEGSHNHTGIYMPSVTANTAYNRNFVADTTTPLATEVPRGNHIHAASGVTYDNSGSTIISSGTVQGATGQLDSYLAQFSTSERCNILAGMTNTSFIVPITAISQGSKITTAMSVGPGFRNTVYSGGDITISYAENPSKQIEGWFSTTVTLLVEANTEYAIALWINDSIADEAFRSIVGSSTNNAAGDFTVSLDGFLTGLSNNDRLSVAIYNGTNTNDVTIRSHTASFAGAPEGAVVMSGTSVIHNETTGREADNAHPMNAITGLETALVNKIDTVIPVASGNIAALDALGQLIDTGQALTEFDNHMTKVQSATLDNIVSMTTEGDSKNAGIKVSDLALVNGDLTQNFKVAVSVEADDAVRQSEMTALASDYTPLTSFEDHTGAANPHGTSYTDVGAAAASHTHVRDDVDGLTDALLGKYDKVATPATDNIPVFETGGLLKDSGVAFTDITYGGVLWVTGKIYNIGDLATDSLDEGSYYALTNHTAGALSPSVDETNWKSAGGAGGDDPTKQPIVQSSYNQTDSVIINSVSTHTFDYALGDRQVVTLNADQTIAFTGFPAGKTCAYIIDAVNWGQYSITWPVGTEFAGGEPPAFTTTVSAWDRLIVEKDELETFSVFVVGLDVK